MKSILLTFPARLRSRLSPGTFVLLGVWVLSGCQSSSQHREAADRSAERLIAEAQRSGMGETEPFFVEPPIETFRRRLLLEQNLPVAGKASFGSEALEQPEHWPGTGNVLQRPDVLIPNARSSDGEPIRIGLIEALQLGAGHAREYQSQKESLFVTALQLDLEKYRFDTSFRGAVEGVFSGNEESGERGVGGTGELGVQRRLESGVTLGGRMVLDLVRLLSGEGGSSLGLLADASITVPLLRGSGRHVVTEARTQAERNLLYALYSFERFKKNYAVRIAREYFSVLQRRDQIRNSEASLERLHLLVDRTDALHEKGRVTGIQVDQGRQDLLRARQRLISDQERYQAELDRFKLTLGLPADSRIELDETELERLMAQAEQMLGDTDEAATGRLEVKEDVAIRLALDNRLDLRVALAEVEDAQRKVAVAADGVRPGLTLSGGGRVGERRSGLSSAAQDNARFDPGNASYSLELEAEAPWDRRSERVAFRRSLLEVESAVRKVQEVEDTVKFSVRDSLRNLLQQRQQYHIQVQALDIAERRVRQAQAFQEVGRADTRDVLESNESLLQAQNAVVDALVSYRISELTFQQNLEVLRVDAQGLWTEFTPE